MARTTSRRVEDHPMPPMSLGSREDTDRLVTTRYNNPMMDDATTPARRHSRRRFLALSGVTDLTGLAGCSAERVGDGY
jgi:hypothetical protein